MNCGAMLELILEADPAELAGEGDSVLARHVRACSRCRAVARRILADTERLGVAVATRVAPLSPAIVVSARGRPSASRRLAMVGVAAATVGIAVLRGGGVVGDQRDSSQATRAVAVQAPEDTTRETRAAAPVVMTSAGVASARTPPTAVRAARRTVAARVEAVAYPKASAVTPALFALSSAEEDTTVSAAAVAFADPAPGKRVAVLRASDPTVTVFWLY